PRYGMGMSLMLITHCGSAIFQAPQERTRARYNKKAYLLTTLATSARKPHFGGACASLRHALHGSGRVYCAVKALRRSRHSGRGQADHRLVCASRAGARWGYLLWSAILLLCSCLEPTSTSSPVTMRLEDHLSLSRFLSGMMRL